jgi:hypothetical protein
LEGTRESLASLSHDCPSLYDVNITVMSDGRSKKLLHGISTSNAPAEGRIVKELLDCCDG